MIQATNNIPQSITIKPRLILLILVMATFGHVLGDMYVPSLPAITQAFHTNAATIQLTLTAFMFGFAIGQLFYGPLSDKIGRRKPLLAGVGISIIGSICCCLANSIPTLIIGRLLEGLGIAVCNSVGRSFVRDLVTGNMLAKISSQIGMLMVFVTATAPTIGGYVQHYFHWRAVFLILSIYSCLIWLYIWFILPETNKHLNPQALAPKILLQNYWKVLSNQQFLGYTLSVSAAYGGIIAFVTMTPFLLQTIVGLTPVQYGWLAFISGAAIFTSFFINSRLVTKIGIDKLILTGSGFMMLAGTLMYFFASLHYLNVIVMMLPMALFAMGAGFTFSNASAGAIQPFLTMAGSAGALFGFLQVLGGVSASAIASRLHISNQFPLAVIFISCGILSFLSCRLLALPAARSNNEFSALAKEN